MDGVHIADGAEPIDAASLEPLSKAGIPTDVLTYQDDIPHTERRRQLLTSHLHDDRWTEAALHH